MIRWSARNKGWSDGKGLERRGNKDMERERQGDEENKEEHDTAAEGQSMQRSYFSNRRKGFVNLRKGKLKKN